MKYAFLILVLFAALFEASGDILLKKWTLFNEKIWFILGISVYFAATVIWAFALRYEFLSKAIIIVTVINVIAVVLFGVVYFNEHLSFTNKIGIVFGLISVALLEA